MLFSLLELLQLQSVTATLSPKQITGVYFVFAFASLVRSQMTLTTWWCFWLRNSMFCVHDGWTIKLHQLPAGQCSKISRTYNKDKSKHIRVRTTHWTDKLSIYFEGSTLVCSTVIYCSRSNFSCIIANRYFCNCWKVERFGVALFWYVIIRNVRFHRSIDITKLTYISSSHFTINNWIWRYGSDGRTSIDVCRCCEKRVRWVTQPDFCFYHLNS